jgi:hypothetical protein
VSTAAQELAVAQETDVKPFPSMLSDVHELPS